MVRIAFLAGAVILGTRFFACSCQRTEEASVSVDQSTGSLVVNKLASAKKKAQPLFPGDMIDHKTGNGYNHGMLYLGSKQQATDFAREFQPDALKDMRQECHYVIDFGPQAPGAGGDDVQSGWWPEGVKVSCAAIADDGEWRWKDYRPFWIKVSPFPVRESIKRAFSLYHNVAGPGHEGHREYDFLRNNCHHFVAWARYGDSAVADRVVASLSAAITLHDFEFPLLDNVLVQEAALACDYGHDNTVSLKVAGPGSYQVRVARTSTDTDNTEGRVKVRSADGNVQEDWKFRSDKGGFSEQFTTAGAAEVVVSGSSHCWNSIFAGCHRTTVAVVLTRTVAPVILV